MSWRQPSHSRADSPNWWRNVKPKADPWHDGAGGDPWKSIGEQESRVGASDSDASHACSPAQTRVGELVEHSFALQALEVLFNSSASRQVAAAVTSSIWRLENSMEANHSLEEEQDLKEVVREAFGREVGLSDLKKVLKTGGFPELASSCDNTHKDRNKRAHRIKRVATQVKSALQKCPLDIGAVEATTTSCSAEKSTLDLILEKLQDIDGRLKMLEAAHNRKENSETAQACEALDVETAQAFVVEGAVLVAHPTVSHAACQTEKEMMDVEQVMRILGSNLKEIKCDFDGAMENNKLGQTHR